MCHAEMMLMLKQISTYVYVMHVVLIELQSDYNSVTKILIKMDDLWMHPPFLVGHHEVKLCGG